MIKLSASMVLYKPDLPTVEQVLGKLLVAIRIAKAQMSVSFDITLVDNSDDAKIFERIALWHKEMQCEEPNFSISLLRAPRNLGYGRGNNLVIDQLNSDYHLVVNPDLFVREDAIKEALRYMNTRPKVGLLTPAVFDEEGTQQYLCKRNPTLWVMFLRGFTPAFIQSAFKSTLGYFEMRDCNYNKVIDSVEYPTGCFMFFRTDLLKRIGGFDPEMFLHYEDADIGRSLRSIAEIHYVPNVKVTHLWARGSHKSWRGKLITVRSGLLYLKKWGGHYSKRKVNPLNGQGRHIQPTCQKTSNVGQGRKILVTGAGGFVGMAACAELLQYGYQVQGSLRHVESSRLVASVGYGIMGDLDAQTSWAEMLKGIDYVLHLAARVHVMDDKCTTLMSDFRRVNVEATINLARQAAAAGVRRFVFMSSIKVNGEITKLGQPFTADEVSKPEDPYALSKYEAEQSLRQIAAETGMEVVIIRPPLVYGPGVKANFATMIRWLLLGVPLPLAAAKNNRRSFVALDNLINLIVTCIHHPAAANQTFLVSDGEDMSTAHLLNQMGRALGQPTRLFYVPLSVLRLGSKLINKFGIYQRLCESLQLDISKNQRLLGWVPPITVEEGLRRTAQSFRA